MLKILFDSAVNFFFALFGKSRLLMTLIILVIWMTCSVAFMQPYMIMWTGLIDQINTPENNVSLRIVFLITSLIIFVIIIPLYFHSREQKKDYSKHIKKTLSLLTSEELYCLMRFYLPERKEIINLNARSPVVLGLLEKEVIILIRGWQGFYEKNMPLRINPIYIEGVYNEINKTPNERNE